MVPVQVADLDAGARLVGRLHVLLAQEVRHPGQLQHPGDRLEDLVGEDDPGQVELARADRGHLPVQDADRLEVAVEHVADPGVAPAQHGLVGAGQVGLEPVETALDQRRAAEVGDREVVPGAGACEIAGQGGLAGVGRVEERERRVRVGDRVQPRDHVDGRVLQPALVLGRGVVEPVVPEVVGQHVLRDHALDPVHEEERRAEHLAGGLHPADLRDGDVGGLADDPDRVVLLLERVGREDREVVGGGRDAGDVLPHAPLAALGPGDVEDQRLRRHAVGVDAAVQRDDRVGAVGQHRPQPPRQSGRQGARVPARALHPQVGRWRCLGHVPLPKDRCDGGLSIGGTCSSCQRCGGPPPLAVSPASRGNCHFVGEVSAPKWRFSPPAHREDRPARPRPLRRCRGPRPGPRRPPGR